MNPSFDSLHPLAPVSDLCQVTALTVPQFSELTVSLLWAFALGGVLTVVCGGFIRDGLFFFVTRLRTWRRFDRAMSRLFARLGR